MVVGTPTDTSEAAATSPTITIAANYIWKLVFDYNNSNNSGNFTQSYSKVESGSYTSQNFYQAVHNQVESFSTSASIGIESGASYGPVSASVSSNLAVSKDVSSALEQTISEQKETVQSYSNEENRTYVVGPQSRAVLYQRTFQAPGLLVQEDIFKSTPIPLTNAELVQSAPIEAVVSPKQFIKDLRVVTGDQPSNAPGNRVRDWFGGSDDINYGQGGKYIWLVPEYTTKVSEALTIFDLAIQSNADPRYTDIAMGSGGKYRYLIPVTQSNINLYITHLSLARFDSDMYSSLGNITFRGLPQGHTQDLNGGRGGTFLYLVWESQRAYTV
ncbi:hypothetical protein C0991_005773 [Blastosporella zonata]|nr:hypothetical protein C0991_005773 [Blastosporella zonata]